MNGLLKNVAEQASRYLEDLGERRVAPSPEALARLIRLDGPLPDGPADPEAVSPC